MCVCVCVCVCVLFESKVTKKFEKQRILGYFIIKLLEQKY